LKLIQGNEEVFVGSFHGNETTASEPAVAIEELSHWYFLVVPDSRLYRGPAVEREMEQWSQTMKSEVEAVLMRTQYTIR
jgi:hypothetical protein